MKELLGVMLEDAKIGDYVMRDIVNGFVRKATAKEIEELMALEKTINEK